MKTIQESSTKVKNWGMKKDQVRQNQRKKNGNKIRKSKNPDGAEKGLYIPGLTVEPRKFECDGNIGRENKLEEETKTLQGSSKNGVLCVFLGCLIALQAVTTD